RRSTIDCNVDRLPSFFERADAARASADGVARDGAKRARRMTLTHEALVIRRATASSMPWSACATRANLPRSADRRLPGAAPPCHPAAARGQVLCRLPLLVTHAVDRHRARLPRMNTASGCSPFAPDRHGSLTRRAIANTAREQR